RSSDTELSSRVKLSMYSTLWRLRCYPEDIAGTFGMPVEQHRQESELRQMDGFVSVGMLTGMPGQQQNL
ncbi:hypothetical protein, partial [Faecalibacterium prausnitzii]|uniref:hypothetical protein n=1 Tax=Faecalibacterium prausnitzii TaxID=853 RepID=UPI001BB3A8A4